MNTQIMTKAPPAAKQGVQETPEAEAENGEDNTFGVALQAEVKKMPSKPTLGLDKPRLGKGQWAATAALAKRNIAVGRTLRGLSALAIERPQLKVAGPPLAELNAAGSEFAGKVREGVREAAAKTEVAEVRTEAPDKLGGALTRSDADRAIELTGVTQQPKQTAPKPPAKPAGEAAAKSASQASKELAPDGEQVGAAKSDANKVEVKAKVIAGGPRVGPETTEGVETARVTAEAAATQDTATRVQTTAKVLMATGSDAPTRVARVTEQMAMMVRDGTQRAVMELHPPDLGRMTLEVEVRGDHVAVKMVVQSDEAYQRLRSDAEALAEALKEQGLDLTGMDVSVDRGDHDDGEQEDAGSRGVGADGELASLMGDGSAGDPGASRARRHHGGEVDLKA